MYRTVLSGVVRDQRKNEAVAEDVDKDEEKDDPQLPRHCANNEVARSGSWGVVDAVGRRWDRSGVQRAADSWTGERFSESARPDHFYQVDCFVLAYHFLTSTTTSADRPRQLLLPLTAVQISLQFVH